MAQAIESGRLKIGPARMEVHRNDQHDPDEASVDGRGLLLAVCR